MASRSAPVRLAPHVRAQLDALVGAWPAAFPGGAVDVVSVSASAPPRSDGLAALVQALGRPGGEGGAVLGGGAAALAAMDAAVVVDDDEAASGGGGGGGGGGGEVKEADRMDGQGDRVHITVSYALGKVALVLVLHADDAKAVPDVYFPTGTTAVQFALSAWYPVAGSSAPEVLSAYDASEPLALFQRLAVLWRAYRGFTRDAALAAACDRVRFELESLGPMPDNEYTLAADGTEIHCYLRLPRDEPRDEPRDAAPTPGEAMELDLGTVGEVVEDVVVVADTQDAPAADASGAAQATGGAAPGADDAAVAQVTEHVDALHIAQDAGGQLPVDTALFVSFAVATGKVKSTRIILPAMHPMAKAVKTPPFPAEQSLHAYLADVRETVIKQTAQFGKSLEARRAFLVACINIIGRPLDYDSYTYFVVAYAFFDVAERKRNFIAVIELPIDFPETPPTLTMRSLTNHTRFVEPENLPFSPRWTPEEMVARLQAFILETNGTAAPAPAAGQYAAASLAPAPAGGAAAPPAQ